MTHPADARYNPRWKWRTIKSEHFTIYYPEGHEAFASRVTSLTGEVHDDIAGYFGIEPDRCPIVLHPGSDDFNGFYSPFPNRISFYETPPDNLREFGPGSDIVDIVFTHEYTHYVHITSRRGWYGALSRILGRGMSLSNGLSPMWAIEGVTTNTETLFTDGGRGRSAYFRGIMLSFSEGEGLWGLNAAGASSPYGPPGGRFYLAGYHMIDYLNRSSGGDVFPRISMYQAEHPLRGTGGAMKKVTGKTPESFYRDFLDDYYTRAGEHKRNVLADGLPQGRVVLSDSLDCYPAVFWTDEGVILAFREGYGRKNTVVELDPADGHILKEIETGIIASFSHPRRTKSGDILYGGLYYHPLGGFDLNTSDLTSFDPETGKHRRITKGVGIFSADLSPDGATLVAARRNGMWVDLVLMDANGSNMRNLVSRPGLIFEGPVWSPDGSVVAATVRSGTTSDIVLVDPESGTVQTLFAGGRGGDADPESGTVQTLFAGGNGGDADPSFSPDGRWIVFSSDRSGVWNIHAWDRREKKLYRLTSVLYNAGGPKLSPDGKTLAFTSMTRGVNTVTVLPFEPSRGKEISVSEGCDLPEPDLGRLDPVTPLTSGGIPFFEAYRPYVHAPWIEDDEDGSRAGFIFVGGDPVGINTYAAKLLYGLDSERAGYDVALVNRSFWPTFTAHIYDTADESDTVGGGRSYWIRERGTEINLSLDIIHRITPSVLHSSLHAGARTRRFDSLTDTIILNPEKDRSLAWTGGLSLTRQPDSASRDMTAGWGQSLSFSVERGLSNLGGELPGRNVIIALTQHTPSPFRHHGFIFAAAHQSQNGFLRYDKDDSIPRGYSSDDAEGGIQRNNTLTLTAEYHFPLLFTDTGIGLMLFHADLVRGSVFVDYGAGWNGDFDAGDFTARARTSAGMTLTTRANIMNAPLEFGYALGWNVHESEAFFGFNLKPLL